MMVAGGAALAAITGALMGHGWGVWPLLFMMLLASVSAGVTACYVISVERRAGALDVAV